MYNEASLYNRFTPNRVNCQNIKKKVFLQTIYNNYINKRWKTKYTQKQIHAHVYRQQNVRINEIVKVSLTKARRVLLLIISLILMLCCAVCKRVYLFFMCLTVCKSVFLLFSAFISLLIYLRGSYILHGYWNWKKGVKHLGLGYCARFSAFFTREDYMYQAQKVTAY